MSALSSFCQSIPASYSIKCFCIPSAAAALRSFPAASFPSILFPHSLSDVRQSQGVKSPFIKMLWNLWHEKFELEWQLLHWALAMAEIVSQVEPIIFGLKYVWGFKSSFVFFRTNTSQYFKWKSLSLFQVMKVSTLCDLMPKYNQLSFYPNSACLSLIILWYWKFKLTQSFNPKKSPKCRDWERYIWKLEPSC